MCEPTTILTVASLAVGAFAQKQQGEAQVAAINKQNAVQAEQIADQASVEMNERARAARRERGAARAVGAEAGINLGSNSFLAGLQSSVFNQVNDQGLIIKNMNNSQEARQANAASLTSQVKIPDVLSTSLQIGAVGYGSHQDYLSQQRAAAQKAVG